MSIAEADRAARPTLRRVSASGPAWGEIVDFLSDEAALLDDDRHDEWLALTTDDICYEMPVRRTLYRRDGRGFDEGNAHFDDDKASLGIRVRRSVEIRSAYERDPAPRMRRLVTNVVVHESHTPDEYLVTSYILLMRNRLNAPTYDMLTAKREDVVRRTDDGLRLARRTILVDQSSLGAPFPNVLM